MTLGNLKIEVVIVSTIIQRDVPAVGVESLKGGIRCTTTTPTTKMRGTTDMQSTTIIMILLLIF